MCEICKNGEIENELHFMFSCAVYKAERQTLFAELNDKFNDISSCDKLEFLCNEYPCRTAKFISKAFKIRQNKMFHNKWVHK